MASMKHKPQETGTYTYRNGDRCRITTAPYSLYGGRFQDAEYVEGFSVGGTVTIPVSKNGVDCRDDRDCK